MLHQVMFLALYLGLLPIVLISPIAGVLLYQWLDNLPPDQVYSVSLGSLSLVTGALTFLLWFIREKKAVPRPLLLTLLMIALLLWENVTWLYALVPAAGASEWNRTVKVIGFAILTAQMLSTRERLEAFIWVFVLSVIYFAVPGAIKFIVSGGSGGIGEGEVVVAADLSFFGDRVGFAVVLAMAVPFALYLGRRATLLPRRWLGSMKPAMLGVTASFLLALMGTFARTGLFAGGAMLIMLAARSQRKIVAALLVAATVVALYAIAPENWFSRMGSITDYETEDSAASRIAAWKWAWAFTLEHPIVGGGFGVFVLDAGSIPGRSGWLEAHNIFFSTMGKHGFVGLGLFCCLILTIYRSCAVIQKRVLRREELAWAADLARATQIALVAFLAGGMFISIDGTPALYMLAGITIGTRGLVERELTAAVRKRARAAATVVQPAE
jgi:putative inorganic carbon (HCO3(-)) transporter